MSENIIKTAREAGAWPQQKKNCEVEYVMSAESLKRFADKLFEVYNEIGMAASKVAVDLAMAMEREQCALIAEHWNCNGSPRVGVAAQIRARSDK
jgi:hypothetical protein